MFKGETLQVENDKSLKLTEEDLLKIEEYHMLSSAGKVEASEIA